MSGSWEALHRVANTFLHPPPPSIAAPPCCRPKCSAAARRCRCPQHCCFEQIYSAALSCPLSVRLSVSQIAPSLAFVCLLPAAFRQLADSSLPTWKLLARIRCAGNNNTHVTIHAGRCLLELDEVCLLLIYWVSTLRSRTYCGHSHPQTLKILFLEYSFLGAQACHFSQILVLRSLFSRV